MLVRNAGKLPAVTVIPITFGKFIKKKSTKILLLSMQISSMLNVAGLLVDKYHFINLLSKMFLVALGYIVITYNRLNINLNQDLSSYSTRCCGRK